MHILSPNVLPSHCSHMVVLSTGFPELHIQLEARKKHVPFMGYLKSVDNQRAFFEELAVKLGIMEHSILFHRLISRTFVIGTM